MITKTDAIKIGKAICDGVKREQQNIRNASPYHSVMSVRGAGVYAMDNLWYDVLPMKVRDAFHADASNPKAVGLPNATHGKDLFYAACGWPE